MFSLNNPYLHRENGESSGLELSSTDTSSNTNNRKVTATHPDYKWLVKSARRSAESGSSPISNEKLYSLGYTQDQVAGYLYEYNVHSGDKRTQAVRLAKESGRKGALKRDNCTPREQLKKRYGYDEAVEAFVKSFYDTVAKRKMDPIGLSNEERDAIFHKARISGLNAGRRKHKLKSRESLIKQYYFNEAVDLYLRNYEIGALKRANKLLSKHRRRYSPVNIVNAPPAAEVTVMPEQRFIDINAEMSHLSQCTSSEEENSFNFSTDFSEDFKIHTRSLCYFYPETISVSKIFGLSEEESDSSAKMSQATVFTY